MSAESSDMQTITFAHIWKIDNFKKSFDVSFPSDCQFNSAIFSPYYSDGTADQPRMSKLKLSLALSPNCNFEKYRDYVALFVFKRRDKWTENDVIKARFSCITEMGPKEHLQEFEWTNKKRFYVIPDFMLRKDLLDPEKGYLVENSFTILAEFEMQIKKHDIVPPISDEDKLLKRSEEIFLHDMGVFLSNEELVDVHLQLDDGEILKAHQAVLAVRSNVFAEMFKNCKDQQINRISIAEITKDIAKELLQYIYTGKVKDLPKYAHDLLPIAEKFQLDHLIAMCNHQIHASKWLLSVSPFIFNPDTFVTASRTKRWRNASHDWDIPNLPNFPRIHDINLDNDVDQPPLSTYNDCITPCLNYAGAYLGLDFCIQVVRGKKEYKHVKLLLYKLMKNTITNEVKPNLEETLINATPILDENKGKKYIAFCKLTMCCIDEFDCNPSVAEHLVKRSERQALDDLALLHEDQRYRDFVLEFGFKGQVSLPANKAILAARWPYLAANLLHDPKVRQENKLKLTDLPPRIGKIILQYIHTGNVERRMNSEDIEILAVGADKYLLEHLKIMCEQLLCRGVTNKNAPELNKLAMSINMQQLQDKCRPLVYKRKLRSFAF